MLSDRSRNLVVGLTILIALAVSMYGIILLGKFPGFGGIARNYRLTILAPNANGVMVGGKVEFNGVYAGQVSNVTLEKSAEGVYFARIDADISQTVDIPKAALVTLDRPISGVGNTTVQIKATAGKDLYAKDGTATLMALSSDSGIIPRETLDLVRDKFAPAAERIGIAAENIGVVAKDLSAVVKDLHVMLAYTTPEEIAAGNPTDPNRPRENVSTAVIRINRTVGHLETLLGDPKLQGQVREAVQNITDASVQLKTTLQKVDAKVDDAGVAIGSIGKAADSINGAATQASGVLQNTGRDISRVSEQLVTTLGSLEKTIDEVRAGKGTTGMLINDPRLYNELVDLSRSLKGTVETLNVLLDKWKDEGVNLKFK